MKFTMERNNKKADDNPKNNDTLKWFITVCIITFILSLIFSYISTTALNNLKVIPAIIILFIVILIGVLFDIIAIAVTVGEEQEFHAKATKKLEGAKTSIHLIRNSAKVANICADVIGDICGVLSGAISAIVTLKITAALNLNFDIQFILSAIVASLTVGGKAIGKVIAQNKSTEIVDAVGKFLSLFQRKKHK